MADDLVYARRSGQLEATLRAMVITLEIYAIPNMEEGFARTIVERETTRIREQLQELNREREEEARAHDETIARSAAWREGLPRAAQ